MGYTPVQAVMQTWRVSRSQKVEEAKANGWLAPKTWQGDASKHLRQIQQKGKKVVVEVLQDVQQQLEVEKREACRPTLPSAVDRLRRQ